MTTNRPDVRVVGREDHVSDVERDLGDVVIAALARVARRNDVMVSITITPFDQDDRSAQLAETDRG